MLSSFDEFFKKEQPSFKTKVPEAVLETMGQSLPAGFKYESYNNGICIITNDEGLNFSFSKENLPQWINKKIDLDRPNGMDDLLLYLYNAQKPIELLPNTNGGYIVNGELIKKEDFIKLPFKNTSLKKGRLYLQPKKFPKAFPVELEGGGEKITVKMRRIPVDDVNLVCFKTTGRTLIDIKMTFDRVNAGKMSIETNIKRHKTSKDNYVSKTIFNALIEGKCHCNGEIIEVAASYKDSAISEDVIRFWKNMVHLESILNVKFDVGANIDDEAMSVLAKLYRSIIENKPFKKNCNSMHMTGKGYYQNCKYFEKNISNGTEILFEWIQENKIELLGASFSIYALSSIFGCKIKDVNGLDSLEDEYEVTLVPTDNKEMYVSSQWYLTKEEAINTQKNKIHLDAFLEAEIL